MNANMFFAFCVIFEIINVLPQGFLHLLSNMSNKLNEVCVFYAPTSQYRPLYEAMVCGTSLTQAIWTEPFRKSGLIHLLVVSGSHLVLLLQCLQNLFPKLPRSFFLPFLVIYSLTTKLQAPVIRSLFALLIKIFNKKYRLFWFPTLEVALAGFLSLVFNPSWFTSYSLLLSWAAALALNAPLNQTSNNCNWDHNCNINNRNPKNHMGHHKSHVYFASTEIMVFLFLWPLLPNLHPASILVNYLMAPILGFVLFPLCTLCFFIPPLIYIGDKTWEVIFIILEKINIEIISTSISLQISLFHWIYLIGLQVILIFLGRNRE